MSTRTGHSCLQPLQDRHRSSASTHLLAAPAVLDLVAAHHLEQQARPSAGGVLLLERSLVAGAHDAFLVTAGADTEAALGRSGEATLVPAK